MNFQFTVEFEEWIKKTRKGILPTWFVLSVAPTVFYVIMVYWHGLEKSIVTDQRYLEYEVNFHLSAIFLACAGLALRFYLVRESKLMSFLSESVDVKTIATDRKGKVANENVLRLLERFSEEERKLYRLVVYHIWPVLACCLVSHFVCMIGFTYAVGTREPSNILSFFFIAMFVSAVGFPKSGPSLANKGIRLRRKLYGGES
ncbi:MAG: hypothetical protein GY854_25050 [Deltaproteobacteria bacterium]|nr:hypothetical protein [Deltaproteobacteria bacterium]